MLQAQLPAQPQLAALEHLEHSHGLPCATGMSNKHVWKTLLHKFFPKLKPDNRLIVKTLDREEVRQHTPTHAGSCSPPGGRPAQAYERQRALLQMLLPFPIQDRYRRGLPDDRD